MYRLLCLIGAYLVSVVLFLRCQFHSSQQSTAISTRVLLNNTEHQLADKKIIFVLIDSAKFAYWQEFPIITELLARHPLKTMLAKTRAEQPTMTTQKIQTLVTGSEVFSLTSIIDAFFSSSVPVDNIVRQVFQTQKRSSILGDDTWTKLFRFDAAYPCKTTFDIWDWETCDNIIYANLQTEIKSNKDFVVAHFLALDHIGHASSSVTHPDFKIKKQKMSKFLAEIVQKMGKDYVLIITGDHGMRDDGNHGGATKEEVQSFMFAYSKSGKLKPFLQSMATPDQTPNQDRNSSDKNVVQIRQPDITATLALLLGVPVPTNSIGIPVFMVTPKIQSKQAATVSTIISSIFNNLLVHFNSIIEMDGHPCPTAEKLLKNQSLATFQLLKEVQQKCLIQTTQGDPHSIHAALFICCMGALCLFMALLIGMQVGEYLIVLVIAIPQSFSWWLIRNSCTYYLTCLLFVLPLCMSRSTSRKSRAVVALAVTILCQIEPDQNGEYANNLARVQVVHDLVTNRLVQATIVMCWCCYRIRQILLKYQRPPRKQSTHDLVQNRSIIDKIKAIVVTGSDSVKVVNGHERWFGYYELAVVLLVTVSQLMKYLAIVEFQTTINLVLVSLTATGLVFTFLRRKSQTLKQIHQSSEVLSMRFELLEDCISIFLGNYGVTVQVLIQLIFKHTLSAPTLKDRMKRGYAVYFAFLLSHVVWWVQGNRYEYSSIDIRQSYIFSSSYHPVINPLCLLVFMMSPYLLVLLLLLKANTPATISQGFKRVSSIGEEYESHGPSYSNNQTNDNISQPTAAPLKQPEQQQETSMDEMSGENDGVHEDWQSDKQADKNRGKSMHDFARLLLLPQVWLICCCINVVYNHGKILYTVVYVPMMAIQSAKTSILLVLVIGLVLARSRSN